MSLSAYNPRRIFMDILKLIEKDHGNVMDMVKKLEKMTDQPSGEADRLVHDLTVELLLHAKSEEQALYEICEGSNEDFKDFALEGFIEHGLVEDMLQKLMMIKPGGNGEFKAHLVVLKELLEHHAEEEEEQEMFPKFRKTFSEEERHEMGINMTEAKHQLRPQIENQVAKMSKKSVKIPASAKSLLKKMPLKGKKKSERGQRSLQ